MTARGIVGLATLDRLDADFPDDLPDRSIAVACMADRLVAAAKRSRPDDHDALDELELISSVLTLTAIL